MPANKVHYSGKQSCNNQGFSPRLSNDIKEVTCQGCLNHYYRKNLGGRPPKAEKPTYKVAFSISPIAYEILQKVPTGDRSSFVSKLIEESNDLAASCGVSIPLTDNENFDNSGTSQHEINRWKQKFGV